jgi:hypothetical protein
MIYEKVERSVFNVASLIKCPEHLSFYKGLQVSAQTKKGLNINTGLD